MGKTTDKKISVKASAAKPLGKPPHGDKNLGLEPEIRFYMLEDGDETAEGEESEIPVFHDSSLALSKKTLSKGSSPISIRLITRDPQWSTQCVT